MVFRYRRKLRLLLAASRPRSADTQMDTRLIGPRQFGYGRTKALPRRSVLATPSFADRSLRDLQWLLCTSGFNLA